jgi:putative membrane protein
MKPRSLSVVAVPALFLALALPALADDSDLLTNRTAWTAWEITPDIALPTGLVILFYLVGMWRRRGSAQRAPWWRHVLFLAGMTSIFLALQSPIDAVADRLFSMHQVQHLLLRMMGPMLLMLSWPESLLIAGLPAWLRRYVVAPVITNGAVRTIFGILAHPVINTFLFIAALYVWQIPVIHDIALRNENIHYVMHMTMLLAGLIFWWRIFDRRAPRLVIDFDDEDVGSWRRFCRVNRNYGMNYGGRLMMLWMVMLSNIILGAYTTLKTVVLYPAYDDYGRLFGIRPLMDEQIGGIIIWIPSSMMCMVAILIIVFALIRYDNRLHQRLLLPSNSNAAALLYPTTGAALIKQARPKNRAMAFGFGLFAFSVFASAILIGVFGRHMPGNVSRPVAQQSSSGSNGEPALLPNG